MPPVPSTSATGAAPGDGAGAAAPDDPALRLRRAAEDMDWVMRFPLATAPGLVFVGARSTPAKLVEGVDPAISGSHAGGAETQAAAFAACLGEASEFLSQFERPGDLLPEGHGLEVVDSGLDWTPPTADHVRALRLHDRAEVAVSADRCLRRPGLAARLGREIPEPPVRLGLGCAAGRTETEARLNAVLELVERDAAALWWRGGAAPRAFDPTDPALGAAFARVASWRGEETGRAMWFADLTTDLGIPVAAAFAADADPEAESPALTVGVAARPVMADAILSAAREAIQGELALALLAERLEHHGDGVATEGDLSLLARAALDPASDPRLAPRGRPRRHAAPAGDGDGSGSQGAKDEQNLQRVVDELAAADHHVLCVTLTRPRPGLHVVWAMAPTLQPDPSPLETSRLRAAAASAASAAGGIPRPQGPSLW
ncbi:YcaO-like family protein [Albimonas sp. CAU 1670]|uniref:YcaO-like family protein n=1 Tax=Albimonas sp. CAU 1670 TaxID=3032599 RepID=UPI0023DA34F1|nr:YcaO-like family protein [Albimonas sp. CAU 1670]MDF2235787.1 YcaO-like family protein [Albimonas sp. CAU 1670]